jgi:ribonuclease BN (tRNA processing enzyme)
MKLTFLGSGSFFAGANNYHSNILFETDNNKRLLIDCGSDIARSLREAGYFIKDVNAIYVSHLHDDHAGGLEYMGFGSYFSPGVEKPDLYAHESILAELWDNKLRVSMEKLTEEQASLSTYFNVRRVKTSFEFDGVKFKVVPAIHIVNNTLGHMYSYGLYFTVGGVKIFFTSDMTFPQLEIDSLDWDLDEYWRHYISADYIFQDCETVNASPVHANYKFVNGFPPEIKKKTYLYHTQESAQPDAVADGFLGIVKKGQVFKF